MWTEISFREAEGKTFLGFHRGCWKQCVLLFSDNTFVTLGITGSKKGDEIIEEQVLSREVFGVESLVDLGIMSSEEVAAIRKKEAEDEIARVERLERMQYEQLKKKYGDTNESC